jgi:hypothetical protein
MYKERHSLIENCTKKVRGAAAFVDDKRGNEGEDVITLFVLVTKEWCAVCWGTKSELRGLSSVFQFPTPSE